MKKAIVVIFISILLLTALFFLLYNPQNEPAVIGALRIDERLGWEKIKGLSSETEIGKLIHHDAVLDYQYGFLNLEDRDDGLLLGEYAVAGSSGYTARVYELGEKITVVARVDQIDKRLNVLPGTLTAQGVCASKDCRSALLNFAQNITQQ